MAEFTNLSRRNVLKYGALASGLVTVGTSPVSAHPSPKQGGMGFMTTKGTDKINPEEEFKIRWEIDHMQWRIDPDCDGGSNYELFQNYSIIDREGDTAGLLLPVDREVKTGADNWHEFQVIQDDCGTSPDDGQNRDLQKIQFKPATGKP